MKSLMMYDLPLLLLPSEKNSRHTYSAKLILLSNFPPHMSFSKMSTIATDKDKDFCDYAYDVVPESLSLWQRLRAIKVELEFLNIA